MKEASKDPLEFYTNAVFYQTLARVGLGSEQMRGEVQKAIDRCFETNKFDYQVFAPLAEAIPGFCRLACEALDANLQEVRAEIRNMHPPSARALSDIAFLMDRHFLQSKW